jgi:integration host factor subunit alpha
MLKVKKKNITKLNLSKKILTQIGFSSIYSNTITNDLIFIIKKFVNKKNLNIKNFGTFKILKKKDRIGRNPKTKKEYKIKSRRSLTFSASKYLNNKINT